LEEFYLMSCFWRVAAVGGAAVFGGIVCYDPLHMA
jgi:hypothetical protein